MQKNGGRWGGVEGVWCLRGKECSYHWLAGMLHFLQHRGGEWGVVGEGGSGRGGNGGRDGGGGFPDEIGRWGQI